MVTVVTRDDQKRCVTVRNTFGWALDFVFLSVLDMFEREIVNVEIVKLFNVKNVREIGPPLPPPTTLYRIRLKILLIVLGD